MTRNGRRTVLLLILVLLGVAALLISCRSETDEVAADDAATSEVVARIGDYAITKGELKERLAQAIRPQRDDAGLPKPPVTPESALRTLVAEKAMIMEGRKSGHLDDAILSASVGRVRRRQLIQLLLTDYVTKNVPVTASEIDQEIQADPNLTRQQAEMKVRSTRATPVVEQYYADLLKKFKVEKVKENFAKASQVHHRLATRPVAPRQRGMYWITNKQIRTELSEEERNLPLVRYVGGQFTLLQWFQTLGEMAPPGRPKNLSRPEGVEGLLDRGLRPVIFEVEAVDQGYDKNEEFVAELRKYEDRVLLGKAKTDKYKEIEQPTDEEIKAFFDEHREKFAKPPSVKVEPVWCKDRETADKVKELLAGGASPASVNEAHGLRKDLRAYNVYPTSEGVFWSDLWEAQADTVVGPVKGFYDASIKWRVVKVIEKKPPEDQPFSEGVKQQVKSAITSARRDEIMSRYEADLLKKYPHEIHLDKVQDIDPLEVTSSGE